MSGARPKVSTRSPGVIVEADAGSISRLERVFRGTTAIVDLGQRSGTFRSRSAFAITETELNVIAALASIGLRSMPRKG